MSMKVQDKTIVGTYIAGEIKDYNNATKEMLILTCEKQNE